jgi:hypothetical protein
MADSHILITLFHDLKEKIDSLNSKNAMMDLTGIEGMKEVVKSCQVMDRYIDSFVYKDEHVVQINSYDQSYLTMTPIPRGHIGPSAEMRRYAAAEDKKGMDKIDRTIQMGRDLEANKHKPYFSIN